MEEFGDLAANRSSNLVADSPIEMISDGEVQVWKRW